MTELPAILLTLKLAATTTLILLIIGAPLAWWLSTTRSPIKPIIEALTAMPLVLPPTVLGFYLLILLNPSAPIGAFWVRATGDTLTFSFAGLVIASVVYSLPFMVQPLQAGFESVSKGLREAAANLGANRLDVLASIVAPLSLRGFITAIILSFAHTIGEFGVVLMVGGNIPERTRVISIAIYENVETLRYNEAHTLSGLLLLFSFAVLFTVYAFNRRHRVHVG